MEKLGKTTEEQREKKRKHGTISAARHMSGKSPKMIEGDTQQFSHDIRSVLQAKQTVAQGPQTFPARQPRHVGFLVRTC